VGVQRWSLRRSCVGGERRGGQADEGGQLVAVLVLVLAVVSPKAMATTDEGGSHGDNDCGGVAGDSNGGGSDSNGGGSDSNGGGSDSNGGGNGLMIAGKERAIQAV